MRISVVINTYNRARSLHEALRALRYQTHDAFEVVVVNGPSTDQTEAVLAEFAGAVRVARCPEAHLARSRNIGIAQAAGDVVAYVDDDAVPEPSWLAELSAAYDSPAVGGAGGIVYDHTGYQLQYRYSACNRIGMTRFDLGPPLDAYMTPGADPFVYLQGTNASFLRRALVEIGGFDEEIEYFLDETEACMRVIDRGYRIRPLCHAAVHHKYLPSIMRNRKRLVFDPYATVKNLFYFALQNGRGARSLVVIFGSLFQTAEAMRGFAEANFKNGEFTEAQRDHFLWRLDRGIEVGIDRGLHQPRRHTEIPPPDEDAFLPFPTRRPAGRRRKYCFLSRDDDTAGGGATGLAAALAGVGHEVHVVTRSPDRNRVNFEDGVWVHRLDEVEPVLPELDGVPVKRDLFHAAKVYNEVARIQACGPLDLVAAPLRPCEGLVCSLDGRFTTVLHGKADRLGVAGTASPRSEPAERERAALEQAAARRACCLPALDPEQTLRWYEQNAERNRAAAALPAPGLEPVVRRFAEVLGEVTGVAPGVARRGADRLLAPADSPADLLAALKRLWFLPEVPFLGGLYTVVLARDADPEGLHYFQSRLRNGATRHEVARQLAQTEGCRITNQVLDVLPRLPEEATPQPGYLAALQQLWPLPDEPFVRGLYLLLLKREADPQGLTYYGNVLKDGTARRDVVRLLAQAEECKVTAQVLDVLPQLPAEATPPAAEQPCVRSGILARLRQRVRTWPGVGSLRRMLRWNAAWEDRA
jgi:glycosyltransferase involved in cell wall biosynthesis